MAFPRREVRLVTAEQPVAAADRPYDGQNGSLVLSHWFVRGDDWSSEQRLALQRLHLQVTILPG